MRNFCPILLIAVGAVGAPGWVRADQLQCNSEDVAGRAVQFLPVGSLVLDYCSLCEAKAQVVRIERVSVVKDCEYEVELGGPVLAATDNVMKEGGYDPKQVRWSRRSGGFSARLDLAYVYVEVDRNDFRWLGGQLGLKAEVKTAAIHLPDDLYGALGAHVLPHAVVRENALPLPTPEMIRTVWHHHYSGHGKEPILVELMPCLEIDQKKTSETRFDCTKPVEGVVDRNATVYAWTTWLVPKGEEIKDITVQFLLDGTVRTTKDMPVNGSSLRTRTFAGAKPGKGGAWTIKVMRGSSELGRVDFKAE